MRYVLIWFAITILALYVLPLPQSIIDVVLIGKNGW